MWAQADPVDRLLDGLAVGGAQRPEQARARSASRRDELADRDRSVDSRLRPLREIADLTHHQLDAPRARLFQPDDDPDERRLAAAVRSRDRDELAAFDLEVDVAQDRRRVAVSKGHLLESKR